MTFEEEIIEFTNEENCDVLDIFTYRIRLADYMIYTDFIELLVSLLLDHNDSLDVKGYTSNTTIGKTIDEYGINGPNLINMVDEYDGDTLVKVNSTDYHLVLSCFNGYETMINLYLKVISVDGGASVMTRFHGEQLMISIIPDWCLDVKPSSNRTSSFVSNEFQGFPEVHIPTSWYGTTDTASECEVMGKKVNLCPFVFEETFLYGKSGHIVDSDIFLVAIAEAVSGARPEDISMIALAMFSTWFSTNGEFCKREYDRSAKLIREVNLSNDPYQRSAVYASASAVWKWVKSMDIVPGPTIDTSAIMRVIEYVGHLSNLGGSSTISGLRVPVRLIDVFNSRGTVSFRNVIFSADTYLYLKPNKK